MNPFNIISDSLIKNATKTNLNYIKTKEYNDKFNFIGNVRLRITVRNCCKRHIRENNKTINESYAIIDQQGNIIDYGSAGKLGGYIPIDKYKDLNDLIITHNHPYSSNLSMEDFLLLKSHRNINSIIAAGHNGSIYSLTKGTNNSSIDALLNEWYTSNENEEKLFNKLKALNWKYEVK